MGFFDRLQHGWNAFVNNRDPTSYATYGDGYYYRPDRVRLTKGNERSIATSVYNRMAVDVASIKIRHVKLDDNERYIQDMPSYLNDCFKFEANLDQSPKAFFQDVALTMFDNGCVAIVPTETDLNPRQTSSWDVKAMRAGKITQWYPKHIKVLLYNEDKGKKEEIVVEKRHAAIVPNPFFTVMNEPNSTLQRLIKKLALLDDIDNKNSAGKLDLIVQLPYAVKSDTRREEAEKRRKDIEMQLTGSKFGVAYTDSTERITQLNRPLENNLWKQIDDLTKMLYSQLGITAEIMNGTADAKTMLNYMNRTIEPIVSAIVDEMNRKFLTKTARTQGQAIRSFSDPFNLVPIDQLTELVGTFTSCAVLTPNECRQIIGMKPSEDPSSDELVNRNIMPTGGEEAPVDENGMPMEEAPVDENGMPIDEGMSETEQPMDDAQIDEIGGQEIVEPTGEETVEPDASDVPSERGKAVIDILSEAPITEVKKSASTPGANKDSSPVTRGKAVIDILAEATIDELLQADEK